MTGRQKLYFLLNSIDDQSEFTPFGQPIRIHPMRNLNNKYYEDELIGILTRLEHDDKVIKLLETPNVNEGYLTNENGFYAIELLPSFEEYYAKIQEEENYQEFTGKKPIKKHNPQPLDLSLLHPVIFSKCQDLFDKGTYAEAVEKGFKVVRDRLRVLTNHETGSEAFGKGNLHIKGAAAQNVDHDFNQGAKFLTMAIDMFRNEKSHTSDGKIEDPQRAYEYLALSSLAMNLLDQAEITNS